ncbi:MAG: type II toxin-antitoxin system RelE/ParE family toxin [Bacteroidota bacterium]
MADVVWTPRALADLQAIGAYFAETSPGYAERLVRLLSRATDRLEVFPASGRIVPEVCDAAFREVIHRNYRTATMHLADDDRVEVLTVFHASRQFGAPPSE